MGHSLHLVHHLWPRVPFYRYHTLYRRLAPLLYDRGVRER
jgi:beta-carotene hydroxylase